MLTKEQQVLRNAWVYVNTSRKCYKEIAQTILNTALDLHPFIKEGCEAVVDGSEEAYTAWGEKWDSPYSFGNDAEGQNWYFAFAWMSYKGVK